MFRMKRSPKLIAAAGIAALFLTACGGADSAGGGADVDAGDPVSGGVARVLQTGEPRSLDPANLSNTWAHQPTLGNALYGSLMINNLDTLEIEYRMATEFSTTDGGTTFTLKLRPDLKFSDGTPLDAAAVKFNWDRLKDPALGSTTIRQAVQIADTQVVDPTTLTVRMTAPNPHFAQALIAGALNWIASPAALAQGQAAFDENPIGAGPFTLVKWTRQDSIELTRNPTYWDAPKPYLDGLTIRTVADTNQRVNSIVTGGSDLASETNWQSLNKVEAAGFSYDVVSTGGGQMLGMNARRAPFDDVRARRAVSLAVDLDAINTAVYNGEGKIPRKLFQEDSPYYADVALDRHDAEEAQRLFDELAAEGKPVKFTYMSYPTTESKTLGEALQAQLSAFTNVEANVEVVDFAAATARAGARDFDMVVTSAIVQDPDFGLWTAFHKDSTGNFTGVQDQAMSDALDVGRRATSTDERVAAYTTVQERLAEVVPGIWYYRAVPAVTVGKELHNVQLYTLGSPLPEEMWISE
ncbi:ABC transporter substrate-binding protein [Rhodococcus zopfii]|uniref:ABC transporter substrate-binding protein n=2 Tax=Rhodococcus zopfii TaxID=43772 RepID=A0ABU3WWG6_9NOCA|nr:ABC transporter substrate-binding protein [Rhodococcus zopfii]